MIKKFVLRLGIIALLTTGCAFGQRIEYRGVSDFKFSYSGKERFTVAVQDIRSYIINSDKKLTFVGLSKSLYGIPYNVNTKSGKPLADDFGSLISETLNRQGISAFQVKLNPFMKEKEVKQTLLSSNRDKIFYFKIKEWMTEVYMRSGLRYDIELNVLNSEGIQLANTTISGKDFFDKKNPKRTNLAVAVTDIMNNLFNDKKIINALYKANTSYPLPKLPKQKNDSAPTIDLKEDKKEHCSVEQILKMKEMGLTDEQIKAACD